MRLACANWTRSEIGVPFAVVCCHAQEVEYFAGALWRPTHDAYEFALRVEVLCRCWLTWPRLRIAGSSLQKQVSARIQADSQVVGLFRKCFPDNFGQLIDGEKPLPVLNKLRERVVEKLLLSRSKYFVQEAVDMLRARLTSRVATRKNLKAASAAKAKEKKEAVEEKAEAEKNVAPKADAKPKKRKQPSSATGGLTAEQHAKIEANRQSALKRRKEQSVGAVSSVATP